MAKVATALADYVTGKHRDGQLVDAPPEVIVGVLRTVLLVPLHADRLGDSATYSKILDLLIDVVTTGLTSTRS